MIRCRILALVGLALTLAFASIIASPGWAQTDRRANPGA